MEFSPVDVIARGETKKSIIDRQAGRVRTAWTRIDVRHLGDPHAVVSPKLRARGPIGRREVEHAIVNPESARIRTGNRVDVGHQRRIRAVIFPELEINCPVRRSGPSKIQLTIELDRLTDKGIDA